MPWMMRGNDDTVHGEDPFPHAETLKSMEACDVCFRLARIDFLRWSFACAARRRPARLRLSGVDFLRLDVCLRVAEHHPDRPGPGGRQRRCDRPGRPEPQGKTEGVGHHPC